MLLSKQTIDILKNLSTINQSIVIKPGNKISSMSVARNILAEAEVKEQFPIEFAIYNLNEFLSAISLFNNPELIFDEKWVLIRENEKGTERGGVKYFYANKALIVHPLKSIKSINEVDAEFEVSESALTKLTKASIVLGVNDIVVVGDEEGIFLIAQDRKNASSNDFEIQVSDKPQKPFKFYFKQENFKFIPGDYSVKISGKGIALFKKSDGIIQYAVALEAV